jgi:acyl-CoA thioester hydrolase
VPPTAAPTICLRAIADLSVCEFFLRFMERSRTNYLRLLRTNQHVLLQEARNDAPGFTFIVRSMDNQFSKAAVLDDVLDVVTLPQEVRGASVTLLQECRRADDLLVAARVSVAFISGGRAQSYSQRPLKLAPLTGLWEAKTSRPAPYRCAFRPADFAA